MEDVTELSEAQWLKRHGIGPKTVVEINALLRRYGLTLKEEVIEIGRINALQVALPVVLGSLIVAQQAQGADTMDVGGPNVSQIEVVTGSLDCLGVGDISEALWARAEARVVADLSQELIQESVIVTRPGVSVRFPVEGSTLGPLGREDLSQLLDAVAGRDIVQITVIGQAVDYGLAIERAQVVASQLVAAGIDYGRVSLSGLVVSESNQASVYVTEG